MAAIPSAQQNALAPDRWGPTVRFPGTLWCGVLCVGLSTACSGNVQSSRDTEGYSDAGPTSMGGETVADVPDSVSGLTEPVPTAASLDSSEPPARGDDDTGVFADGTPVPSDTPGVSPENCDAPASVSGLTKLSTVHYRNTVRDLLRWLDVEELLSGVEPALMAIPEDSRAGLFSGSDSRVALEHVEGYYQVAKRIAEGVSNDEELRRRVASECAAEEVLSSTCLEALVEKIGVFIYRHPLTEAERAELTAVATQHTSSAEQIRAVLLSALISPRFVNHVEVDGAWIGGATDLLQLSAYEVVSRLSYTFWQTMPDPELFQAAADGSVLTSAGLARTVQRVLDDARTKDTLWRFWREWFALDGFTGFEFERPGFQALTADLNVNEQLYEEMKAEVRALTDEFTFSQPGTLRDLIETDVSVTQSTQLAGIYGIEPWSGVGAYPRFDTSQRAGLFQRAALLVSSLEQTNPFHRGAFFKRHLLCEALPSPDPTALPPGSLDIPPASDVQTTRQRFENKVANNELCTGCHGLFSSVGYTLEAFDSLGRYRNAERIFDEATGELLAELPLDTSASVIVGGQAQTIASPADLNRVMSESGQLEACLAQQYFVFVNRRSLAAGTSDTCVQREVAQATQTEGLLAGFRRIAELTTFYQRKVGSQ